MDPAVVASVTSSAAPLSARSARTVRRGGLLMRIHISAAGRREGWMGRAGRHAASAGGGLMAHAARGGRRPPPPWAARPCASGPGVLTGRQALASRRLQGTDWQGAGGRAPES